MPFLHENMNKEHSRNKLTGCAGMGVRRQAQQKLAVILREYLNYGIFEHKQPNKCKRSKQYSMKITIQVYLKWKIL
jgi:hypothetical protein